MDRIVDMENENELLGVRNSLHTCDGETGERRIYFFTNHGKIFIFCDTDLCLYTVKKNVKFIDVTNSQIFMHWPNFYGWTFVVNAPIKKRLFYSGFFFSNA